MASEFFFFYHLCVFSVVLVLSDLAISATNNQPITFGLLVIFLILFGVSLAVLLRSDFCDEEPNNLFFVLCKQEQYLF